MTTLSQDARRKLRWLYATNIAAAGIPGMLLWTAPRRGSRQLFGRRNNDPALAGMLGGFWLSVAGLSALGLRYPEAVSGLVPIQLSYKSLWLLRHGLPRLLRGERRLASTVGIFGAIVALYPFAYPFRQLFGRARTRLTPVPREEAIYMPPMRADVPEAEAMRFQ